MGSPIKTTEQFVNDAIAKHGGRYDYSYDPITVIEGSAVEIWTMERDFKRKNKTAKYLPLKTFGGRQECFTHL